MKKHPKFKIAYLIFDFILLSISFIFSIYLSISDFSLLKIDNVIEILPYFILYVISMGSNIILFFYYNLYNRDIIRSKYRQIYLIVKIFILSDVAIIIGLFAIDYSYFTQDWKDVLFWLTTLNIVYFLSFRMIVVRGIYLYLSKKNIYQQKVLIIGGDKAGKNAYKVLQNDNYTEFKIVGFLDDYKKIGVHIERDFYNLGKLENINKIVKEYHIDEILIAIDNSPYERMIHIVKKAMETKKTIRIYSNLLRIISEKLKVEYYSSIPVMKFSNTKMDGSRWTIKRIFDVFIAFIGLIILSPILISIGIGIKLSSKGPIIFKQKRIGKNGVSFNFYKFRSMHLEKGDSTHKKFVTEFIKRKDNEDKINKKIYKITDDPRIFKFGKFIRKTSLDELPQLVNVLKGEMSIVGPRPCLSYEWDCYQEWHKTRLNIPAGCTGLWQAFGRSSVNFEEMVILDLYYLNNISFWFDLKIILHTIPVILFAKGGY